MAVKIKERNGKWWLYVDWRGQRKAKCIGTKEAAEAVKIALEARLVLGAKTVFEPDDEKPRPVAPAPLLFGDYFRTWLDTCVRHACKESTWKIYDLDFRVYLDPVFGEMPLADISREAIIEKLIHPLLTGDAATEDKRGVP